MLEIAVHGYECCPRRMVEPGEQRVLVAEIAGQGEAPDTGIASAGLLDFLPRPVAASVIHQYHLVIDAGQHLFEPSQEGR